MPAVAAWRTTENEGFGSRVGSADCLGDELWTRKSDIWRVFRLAISDKVLTLFQYHTWQQPREMKMKWGSLTTLK